MQIPDRELLDRYLASSDERAFRLLMERHLPLIHGVARRVTENEEMAREVTQQTLIRLARNAAKVPRTASLPSWLHRMSRHLAIDLIRAENSRKKRELSSGLLEEADAVSDASWSRLAPVIDEMVNRLSSSDRDVLLRRYYRNESHAEIARELGLTESVARKRAFRALEKLRAMLSHAGIASPASALAVLLPTHAAPALPPGVATGLANAAAASAASSASHGATALSLTMTTSQKLALAALALILAGVGTYASFSGHFTAGAGTIPVATISAVGAGTPSGRPRTPPVEVVPTNAADRLVRLRSILVTSSRFLRDRSLINYLDRLSPGQIEEAAMFFGSGQIDPDGCPTEYSLIVAAWARVDPIKALAYAETRHAGDGEFETVITTWASRDPYAAMNWSMAQSASPSLDHTPNEEPGRIISVVGLENPEMALAMVDEHPEWRIYLDTESIFSSWAAMEPAKAIQAIERIPAGEGRNAAVDGIAQRLTGINDSFKLLDQYPDATTDRLVERLVDNGMWNAPAASLSGIERIKNERVRNQCYVKEMKRWIAKDPEAARTFLESGSLSDEVRQQLKESR